MAKKNMGKFSRWVYGVVGIAGGYSLVWLIMNGFSGMGFLASLSYVLLTVGGVNWGLVAITGDRDKDLFGLLKI